MAIDFAYLETFDTFAVKINKLDTLVSQSRSTYLLLEMFG